MILKLFTFILLLLVTVISHGQTLGYDKMRPSQLILKNGDTLNVIGKLKSNVFKYKKYSKAKPNKIGYSEIESIKIRFKKDFIQTFKLLSVKGGKILPVEELVVGRKISLYGVTNNFISKGVGGMRFQGTAIRYYIMKQNDYELTKLGDYSFPFRNLKEKIKTLFKDCDLLLKKIKNKEFRMRSDVQKMFVFYNKDCK